ncbi:MAG TPA: SDR family NAD(P)-dependent oxidoreductase, partial [Solirubrobacteraceae bacterium]|nr:SDR family NAD(P)-dependent oxidoreductase [Solirubrobacteraceae bacterium]
MKVDGSRALLTGATGGLGAALAKALHEKGSELLVSGRRQAVLEPLAGGLGARAIAADLGRRDDVERLVRDAGDVDILVANAALPASGLLLELSQSQIDTMLEVNLNAPIALVRALAPAMVARGRGHIVLISSLSGKSAGPASSIYSATKFGLRGFAHGVRSDLRGTGVGVSV